MAATVDSLLQKARRELAAAPSEPQPREAALLLGRVLGWSEARVLAHGEQAVTAELVDRFRHLLQRRVAGEPFAYLVQEREFYGRPFHVDRRVLVPRPETEHLVEAVLDLVRAGDLVVDVGTGSGCVAVTVALERPASRVVATDLAPAALAVAAGNARRHGARVGFLATDLAAAVDLGGVAVLVSNPPYLATGEGHRLAPEVREHEPELALFAGEDGGVVLRRLLDAGRRLAAGAHLVVEIGYGQEDSFLAQAGTGPWSLVRVQRDLAGIPRVVVLQRH